MGSGRNGRSIQLFQLFNVLKDIVELVTEILLFLIPERQAGQARDMFHFLGSKSHQIFSSGAYLTKNFFHCPDSNSTTTLSSSSDPLFWVIFPRPNSGWRTRWPTWNPGPRGTLFLKPA